jgi:hypothetical protein
MLSTRFVYALVSTLLIPCVSPADVNIRPGFRMVNRPPGRCGWCALETLARHHGIKALYGLVEDYPCTASPEEMTGVLDQLQVHYRLQPPGRLNTTILQWSCRDGLGAAVGLRTPSASADRHIVTLVDFGPQTVRIIDPNDRNQRVCTMTREHFLDCWDGFALVLQP